MDQDHRISKACVIISARKHAPEYGAVTLANKKCEGVEHRKAHHGSALRRPRPNGDASPSGAPLAAFLSSGPCFRARTGGHRPTPIRAAFAALRPCLVQPLKAAGHRAGGRLPEASRYRGYKPQQRAPHLPRVGSVLQNAPRVREARMRLRPYRIIVKISGKYSWRKNGMVDACRRESATRSGCWRRTDGRSRRRAAVIGNSSIP